MRENICVSNKAEMLNWKDNHRSLIAGVFLGAMFAVNTICFRTSNVPNCAMGNDHHQIKCVTLSDGSRSLAIQLSNLVNEIGNMPNRLLRRRNGLF